jgi:phosphohistidine phosphatase
VPEKVLVLLRHAKSDWSGGVADIARPLARRGRRQAAEAGRWLGGHLATIDLAVVSPAQRTRSTWQLAAAETGQEPPTRVDDRVYAASVEDLLGVLRDLPETATTVLLVGHNPGMEEVASVLTGVEVPMPTSAIAVVSVPGSWSDVGHSPGTVLASGRPPAQ